MFKNTFVSGFLSVFYSLGSDPLQLWAKRVGSPPSSRAQGSNHPNDDNNGEGTSAESTSSTPSHPEPHIDFVIDDTLNSKVLELISTHLPSTFITTPSLATRTLGIKLPFLVFMVKNLGKYWTFEVTVLDDRGEKRRFRASNFQTTTRVKPYITTMPMRMDPGWNQIQLNLADYTKRAYGTTYVETQRITIHANCRIRRIYFSDRLVPENELPAEFKLYLPVVNLIYPHHYIIRMAPLQPFCIATRNGVVYAASFAYDVSTTTESSYPDHFVLLKESTSTGLRQDMSRTVMSSTPRERPGLFPEPGIPYAHVCGVSRDCSMFVMRTSADFISPHTTLEDGGYGDWMHLHTRDHCDLAVSRSNNSFPKLPQTVFPEQFKLHDIRAEARGMAYTNRELHLLSRRDGRSNVRSIPFEYNETNPSSFNTNSSGTEVDIEMGLCEYEASAIAALDNLVYVLCTTSYYNPKVGTFSIIRPGDPASTNIPLNIPKSSLSNLQAES
ncbi:hypothetical protein EMPS_09739 [Entomortierella parvispora]|uniref:CFA20 domain-containing protein n=1 Tax=Entomortierella parvispora TaxID=205924 RepID=A0A9P3M0W0_9FUNG|nr:hypothetical protein EMPS_09739 [Entomortierella parvispora]